MELRLIHANPANVEGFGDPYTTIWARVTTSQCFTFMSRSLSCNVFGGGAERQIGKLVFALRVYFFVEDIFVLIRYELLKLRFLDLSANAN